jgi:hypothetical protein
LNFTTEAGAGHNYVSCHHLKYSTVQRGNEFDDHDQNSLPTAPTGCCKFKYSLIYDAPSKNDLKKSRTSLPEFLSRKAICASKLSSSVSIEGVFALSIPSLPKSVSWAYT